MLVLGNNWSAWDISKASNVNTIRAPDLAEVVRALPCRLTSSL
jgi:hypothetical protein